MTAEEFCAFVHRPENEQRWFELVRGEVIELPVPQRPHGSVCANICGLLFIFKRQVGWGDVVSNDSGVVLEQDPDTVRGPDIAFFAEPQADDEQEGYSLVPPLLAVEVLSPNDKANLLARKIADYLANGVALVWVVDPANRTVVVYRQANHPGAFFEEDEITGEEVLPGFRCKVADFFPSQKTESAPKPTKKKRRNGKAK